MNLDIIWDCCCLEKILQVVILPWYSGGGWYPVPVDSEPVYTLISCSLVS